MANDPTVSNSPLTDIPVRGTETAGAKIIQHVRLDTGSGSSESVISGALPICADIVSGAAKKLSSVDVLGFNAGLVLLTDGLGNSPDFTNGEVPISSTQLTTINSKITACNTGAVVVSSSALPSGASTEATLSSLNSKVTACNTGAVTISAALPTGSNAIGKLAANSGVDIGDVTINNTSGASAVNIQDGGNSITIDGSVTATQSTASSFNAQVVGEIAHDSADSGNPIKIGGKAIDMTPDTDAEQGPADVAANDRANALFDLKGRLVESVNARYNVLDNVSTTYNNTTTTATSTGIVCWQYRKGSLAFTLAKANTPTEIQFTLQGSNDGTNYFDVQNDFLGAFIYDDVVAGTGPSHLLMFDIAYQKIRLKVTATGTTASATFTVSNASLYLRN